MEIQFMKQQRATVAGVTDASFHVAMAQPEFASRGGSVCTSFSVQEFSSAAAIAALSADPQGHPQASQVVLVVKNPPASAGEVRDARSIPGSEDPLEESMAAHFTLLAWRIPWTEAADGLQSIRSHRVGHD